MLQHQDERADASGVRGDDEGRRGRGGGAAVTASARVGGRYRTPPLRRVLAGAGEGRANAVVRCLPCGQVCIRHHAIAVRQQLACLP